MQRVTRWLASLLALGAVGGAAVVSCVSDDQVGSGVDASTETSTGDATSDSGCTARVASDTTGAFVDINGADSSTCGARSAPCQTIQMGIAQAKLLDRTTVYVARGTYPESVALAAGITVEGGWDTLESQWIPVCGSDEISAVKVQMPDAANAVMTASFTGTTTVRLMTLLGKSTVAPSESLYGVLAQNANITLDSLVITLGGAGAGIDADGGAPGTTGGVKCAQDDGGAGTVGNDGTGAPSGDFTSTGYGPTSGTSGASDGGIGNAGPCTLTPSCDTICGNGQCAAQCKNALGGCGGSPGVGGSAGTGGGSSIAVYGWNANITVLGGAFTAGSGGNGGNGGGGGAGGPGGAGTSEQELCLTCMNNGTACATVGDMSLAAGVSGGTGGAGGHGGGGSGGYSYAVYSGGDAGAVTLQNNPTFVHGTAGTGGTLGGAVGVAADRGP